jgi:hypothetical protein
VIRLDAAFTVISIALLTGCVAPHANALPEPGEFESKELRAAAIRRANVWAPTDIRSMDLKAGPQGKDAFTAGETVTCNFVPKPHGIGTTRKFHCTMLSGGSDRDLKVRYGKDNGEVYGHVAATRLLWALGFPATKMYPVKVVCRGCPPDPYEDPTPRDPSTSVTFDPATIEEKADGKTVETKADEGWKFSELDDIDEYAGGAPLAHRDSLKLLAALIQHASSKPMNQRLVCFDKPGCGKSMMLIADLGKSFGASGFTHKDPVAAVNFSKWAPLPVWKNATGPCMANLHWTWSGSLSNPMIGEAGRKFLADLLNQLSDAQLRDLFEVARFTTRDPNASVSDWVEAFKKKRAEIANRTC